MKQSSKALLSLFLCLSAARQAAAQAEVCKDLFAQGYYDENTNFSDRQSFKFVQGTICSDNSLSRESADNKSLGSGGTYYSVISGFLNLGDQQKSFEQQRQIFCSLNLDTSNLNTTAIQKSRVVSKAATQVMTACFESQTGFHAAVIPSRNPSSFAIKMAYHGEGDTDIRIDNISASQLEPAADGTFKSSITCDVTPTVAVPVTVHSGKEVLCNKPVNDTVQVTMNTSKGSLRAIDVLGKKDINEDIQGNLKVLTDKIGEIQRASCLGCIEPSILTEAQFQAANGSNWVLCDGRSIVGSKLADSIGISAAPDLRGLFLRGKNNGRSDGKENPGGEIELGKFQDDQFQDHVHEYNRGLNGGGTELYAAPANVNGGILRAPTVTIISGKHGDETRPRNISVNYFVRIN